MYIEIKLKFKILTKFQVSTVGEYYFLQIVLRSLEFFYTRVLNYRTFP